MGALALKFDGAKNLHGHVEGKNVPLVPRSTIFPNQNPPRRKIFLSTSTSAREGLSVWDYTRIAVFAYYF